LHGIGVAASFVIFECIGQGAGVATEREIVAGVGSDDHRAAHVEAMQIALQASSGHADSVIIEVVARGEADVPPFAKPHVATDVERLREHVGIAHGVVIELGDVGVLAHGDAVAKGD
jgi:hypothetical protein